MRDMDHAEHMLTLSEPFDDKPEYTVGQHINGIYGTVKSLFRYLTVENDQKNRKKYQLCSALAPSPTS